MAGLMDSNGQIVINELEAEADIRKIIAAKQRLAEVRNMLNPSKLDDEHMLGSVRSALEEKLAKMNRDLDKYERSCDSVIKYIRSTIDKYKRIDREYKRKAQSLKGGR
ncbi:MAG: hypothetical protein IJ576_03645 [Synergistaceae bacterium]|nr:hypothetical protein [Synergistaceae bacterium]MBR1603405.1 hypothetical protein [Synergistaceae bacterium]